MAERAPKDEDRDELIGLVKEAATAARAAQDAAEKAAASQPSRFERFIAALSALLRTLVDLVLNRILVEVERARRASENFVATLLRAIARTIGHIGRAILYGALALVFVTIAAVVLTIALAQGLNNLLGEPWGTAITGGLFALVGITFFALARGRVKAISDEADALAPWRRG